MAFEPVFSPDGSAVAFVDLSEPQARLLRYDLTTREIRLIRRASQEDNYRAIYEDFSQIIVAASTGTSWEFRSADLTSEHLIPLGVCPIVYAACRWREGRR